MTLEDDLAAAAAIEDADRPAGLGPSSAGKCGRQLAYRERKEPPSDVRPVSKREAGKALHRLVTDAWRLIYPEDLVEHEVTIPGLKRTGRVDRYDKTRRRVIDLKTVDVNRAGARILNQGAADPDAEDQAMIYALALNRAGFPVDEVEILYVDRSSLAEVASFVMPYDESVAADLLADLIDKQEAIDSGGELDREGDGPGSGMPCDFCEFLSLCWDVTRVPEGMSPQSWLRTVDSESARQAASDYDRGRALAAEGETLQSKSRAALVGVEGLAGDLYVGWTRPKPGRMVTDETALLAWVTAWFEGEGVPLPERWKPPASPQIQVRLAKPAEVAALTRAGEPLP